MLSFVICKQFLHMIYTIASDMRHLCLVSVIPAVDNDKLALCIETQHGAPPGNRAY